MWSWSEAERISSGSSEVQHWSHGSLAAQRSGACASAHFYTFALCPGLVYFCGFSEGLLLHASHLKKKKKKSRPQVITNSAEKVLLAVKSCHFVFFFFFKLVACDEFFICWRLVPSKEKEFLDGETMGPNYFLLFSKRPNHKSSNRSIFMSE